MGLMMWWHAWGMTAVFVMQVVDGVPRTKVQADFIMKLNELMLSLHRTQPKARSELCLLCVLCPCVLCSVFYIALSDA